MVVYMRCPATLTELECFCKKGKILMMSQDVPNFIDSTPRWLSAIASLQFLGNVLTWFISVWLFYTTETFDSVERMTLIRLKGGGECVNTNVEPWEYQATYRKNRHWSRECKLKVRDSFRLQSATPKRLRTPQLPGMQSGPQNLCHPW